MKFPKYLAAMLVAAVLPFSTATAASIQDTVLNGLRLDMPQEEAMKVIEKKYEAANVRFDRTTCRENQLSEASMPYLFCDLHVGVPKALLGYELEKSTVTFSDGKLGEVSVYFVLKQDKRGRVTNHFDGIYNKLWIALNKELYRNQGLKGAILRWKLDDRFVDIVGRHPDDMQSYKVSSANLSLSVSTKTHRDRIKYSFEKKEKSFWGKLFD